MPRTKRIVRYGGALYDQSEIDAVVAQLHDPIGLLPGKKVVEFERRVADADYDVVHGFTKTGLQDIYFALADERFEIQLDDDVIDGARRALDRMLAVPRDD